MRDSRPSWQTLERPPDWPKHDLAFKPLRSLTNPAFHAKRARETWVENQWVDGSVRDPYFPPAFGIHPGLAGAFC